MRFLGHSAREDVAADRAARAPQEIDVAADCEEAEPAPSYDGRLGVSTILGFWLIAAALLLVIVAAPALEAAAHRLH
ncbi:MAG TPA: hypothetical protein VMQ11_16445 [Alphaproteobacteria bacterium]|nr:hypothetical protein [Alphaproteobacteria bacterium]